MAATKPDRLHYTGNDEADALLAHDPFALLVGFALDQQVPVQTAFQGPLKLQAAAGDARPRPDRGHRSRPARRGLPREAGDPPLPRQHGRRVQDLASVVVEDYGGDAERVWREAADGADLRKRISACPASAR